MKCPSQTKSVGEKGWETEKETANEQICLREDISRHSFPENIIYLHNLHKLLWRHITRFVPAFRRRSLHPVFPRGEGTATRRLSICFKLEWLNEPNFEWLKSHWVWMYLFDYARRSEVLLHSHSSKVKKKRSVHRSMANCIWKLNKPSTAFTCRLNRVSTVPGRNDFSWVGAKRLEAKRTWGGKTVIRFLETRACRNRPRTFPEIMYLSGHKGE